MSDAEDVPGDYDSLQGMKDRAVALGNPIVPMYIERAEDRLVERGDGYSIEAPDVEPNDAEMLFHFGILAGAALEREYPAPGDGADLEDAVSRLGMLEDVLTSGHDDEMAEATALSLVRETQADLQEAIADE